MNLQAERKLKRSNGGNYTRTSESFMDDVQDEFGDFDLGVYHKPVDLSNTSNVVEVNCGNIGSMLWANFNFLLLKDFKKLKFFLKKFVIKI